jgi:nitrile hydratase subunit beta
MKGIHDVGGMRGFGPVRVDPDEPRFHADWERRVLGLNMATLVQDLYNVDENRFARERIPPAEALTSTYWELLLRAMETCLVERGIVSAAEIEARVAELAADPGRPTAAPGPEVEAAVLQRMAGGLSRQRTVGRTARFAPGDAVVTRRAVVDGHSRLPDYARGRRGVVERVHEAYVLPDANAHGGGERPEQLYLVRFTGAELWGAPPGGPGSVSMDLWESYLEPA